jgi:hypothetical protein
MSKEYRPGFWYIRSAELNQEVALSVESGWVYCEDKGPDGKLVNYSPEEIGILKTNGLKVTMGIHLVKRVFGGRIVEYDGPGPDSKGKPDVGKEPDSTADDTDIGEKVSETTGNSQNYRPGELDIY